MAGEYASSMAASPPVVAARRLTDRVARLNLIQRDDALGPVRYTPSVVLMVGGVGGAAIALGIASIRAPQDPLSLAVGATAMLLMSAFSVRSLLPIQTNWSASAFLNLGLAITLGPIGAAAGALGESLGMAIRTHNGWFRTLFNVANIFVTGVVAYTVFQHTRMFLGGGVVSALFAGLAASTAHFLVNWGLLALVVHAASPEVKTVVVLRSSLSTFPYTVGFGWSAFAFIVLHDQAGVIGFTALIMPVVLLQAALVVFTRRFQAYEEQRAAHQREREDLLQKAVEASEIERRRIARDLHDGVVQDLTGMAFALTAASARLKDSDDSSKSAELIELLDESAEGSRVAMKDLRTLIIEIAPPTLRREGLHAALLEVLKTLERGGTQTSLELPSNMRLRPDRASLIFRVAQEILRNVAAHAEAKSVSVGLRQEDGQAVLRIDDDGKGFSVEDVMRRRAEGHVGTNAIVELAEEAGGSLTIDSAPGKGTRVTLLVPVE